MTNGLLNASFLDGITGWQRSPTAALTTWAPVEASRGAPGRAVLRASGVSTASAQTTYLGNTSTNRPAVTPGALVEVFGLYWGNLAGVRLNVLWRDAGGALLSTVQVTKRRSASGTPSRGLPTTFDYAHDILTAPASAASVEIRVQQASTANAQAQEILLLHPYIAVGVAAGSERRPDWIPGAHSNPDLNLRVWPLKPPLRDGYGAEQTPTHHAFQTDARIPMMGRVGSTSRRVVRPTYVLDEVERDTLQQFFDATEADGDREFWYVDPGTKQLYRAFWTEDGTPTDLDYPAPDAVRTSVGLFLTVA